MPFLVTSNLAAIVLLFILAISGAFTAARGVSNFHKRRRKFVILEVDGEKARDLNKVLASITPPFTLEVVVSQLGKTKSFYLTLPSGRSKKAVDALGARQIDDYDLYYPGGAVVGGYASGESSLKDFSADSIDFSEVNEIGEGAVVQFVIKKKSNDRLVANIRTLVSAPSSYQAKEIFTQIKNSFADMNLTEIKSAEFIDRVNNRIFSQKELASLSL